METALKHQIITLEDCGPVSVFMQVSIKVPGLRPSTQGDERRLRDGVVFLTVHDVGCTYQVLGSSVEGSPPSLDLGQLSRRREHGGHPR